MKYKHIIFIAVIIVHIFFLSGCSHYPVESRKAPIAFKGVLDLTNWDFEKNGLINLDGEWEFYREMLLHPDDFQGSIPLDKVSYIRVPGSWNKHESSGQKMSGSGYATYRLVIKTNQSNDKSLGLKIPRMFTSYSLWSSNELIASNGKPASNKEEYVPQYYPKVAILSSDNSTIQLIVQVSNFSHRSGGMLESIKLGTEEQIIKAREYQLALELFLFGCLIIMGIYHIVLFLFRRKNMSSLFFGVYCVLIAIRTLFVGEIFFIHLFPGFNWEIQHKIQTLSFYAGVPVFVMFVNSIFPDEYSKKALKLSQITGIFFSLLVLLTPVKVFTVFNPVYQLLTALLTASVAYAFILACKKSRQGAVLITLGGVFFLLTVINDMMFLSVPFNDYRLTFLRHIIRTGNLSSFGLIVLIFSQSTVLAMTNSKAFSQVEEMSEKLIIADKQKNELLASLEDKVRERTLELEQSNSELSKAYRELSLLESSRKRLLTNISHDLKTPMTLIQGYTEAILDNMIEDEEERKKYLKLIRSKVIGLTLMTNDLFELSQLESRQIKMDLQKISISTLFSKITAKYQYDIEHAGLSLKLDMQDAKDVVINIDINRIDRVFSNLIYNALRYTQEGQIAIKCSIYDISKVLFEVSDTGSGISEDDLPFIFDRFYTASKSRNSSLKSSGLGLAIAKEIVEYHGGSIWVDSKLDHGSSFYFTVGKFK